MDKKTLKALKGSIKKWKGILDGTTEDKGALNCPLCKLFLWRVEEAEGLLKQCVGCPVSAKTGGSYCEETPYDEWFDAGGYMQNAHNRTLKRIAKAELKFLQSLLPKE